MALPLAAIERHGAGPFVIYVLHFDRPHNRTQHYVGSTTPQRLRHRWREHQLGRGGRTTWRMHRAGIGFTAAVIELAQTRDREGFWKGAHQARRFCPVCQGTVTTTNTARFDAIPTSSAASYSWP